MSFKEISLDVADALRHLTQWTSALAWEDVPEDVRERAALIFSDDFAAMVAARNEPELLSFREGVSRSSGRSEATIFDGNAYRHDRYSAALYNGTAADWCELDGGYRKAVCHAALYCIPALLAESEATNASVRDMLLALVVGYETVSRVARAFSFPGLVLQPHGGLATIGSAATVAKLRNFSASSATAAICTGATLVIPGPFGHAVEGALIRNVWPGICAQNGIRAADFVSIGISGGPESLSDVFCSIFGATASSAPLSDNLGQEWAMRDAYHKMHACCQYAHSTVEAVLSAIDAPLDPNTVKKIEVATHWKARKLDNAQPKTTLAAKFSIQHIAAATLTFGHAGAEAFHSDTLLRSDLTQLRDRVVIVAHEPEQPEPNDRPSRVSITMSDGRTITAECLSAPGGSDRPFPPDVIMSKALAIIDEAYPNFNPILRKLIKLDEKTLMGSWSDIVANYCIPTQ